MSRLTKVLRKVPSLVATCQEKWRRTFRPTYDEELFDVMKRVLRRDSSCVDVGAHCGTILKEIVAIAPHGKHHAFEPIQALAQGLKRDFPQVTVHASAVGERTGATDFHHIENAPSYSGIRQRIYDRPDPQIVKIQVPVTTLDQAIPCSAIALIKLDIEGGEYHALRGAQDLIRRSRPFIAFEASNNSTGQYGVTGPMMYDLLALLQYDIFIMKRWLSSGRPTTKANFVANWSHGPDFFWLAAPLGSTAGSVCPR